ncbi:MAG: LPS-assembly protein LptD [Zoogloeaceae bacterium]|nr:LPS-assembly protein LptD [Zoogloeaceae bacterium]
MPRFYIGHLPLARFNHFVQTVPMTGFSPRPLAFLIACLCAGNASAVLAAPSSSVVLPGKGKAPAEVEADRIIGQTDRSTRAEGSVVVRQADSTLHADRLTYFPLEDEIEAEGHVRLIRPDTVVNGTYLRLKTAAQLGYLDDAVYQISREIAVDTSDDAPTPSLMEALPALPTRRSTAYGQARRIHFEGENHYRVEAGSYTTCKPGEWDWYAKSEEITLDYDQEAGKAKDATLYFKDVPILYAPRLSFPLNNARKSGFLAPTFASSTKTGFDLTLPYYWNIAPNYDATLTPRVMSKRGLQFGGEMRYRNWFTESEFQAEILKDRQFEDRRYAYNLRHRQDLGKGFATYIDWNGVSDDAYFTDLSSRVVETSKRQLPREFNLYYNRSWLNATLQTLRYQTLNPGDETRIGEPYFIAPRLSFTANAPEWKGLDFSTIGQYTHFVDPNRQQAYWNGKEGQRLVLYPQLAYHFIRPGYYIRPKIGLHSTQYRLKQRGYDLPETLSRNLPVFSLDAGMTFERDARWGGRDWLQTLEPRLFYLRIPHKDQSQFPNFDTGLADFNFAQMFSENRFSGYDRVNNANQLTAALTTRLIDPKTGAERMRVMVGQRYYFTSLKIGLPGEDLDKNRYSEFLAAFSGQVRQHTYVDAAMEYDFDKSAASRITLAGRYQPAHGKVLSVAYRYNRQPEEGAYVYRDTMKQIDLAGQWQLSGRWNAVGRYNYAFDSSRLVEGIAGVEYNAGCWVARFVAQRLETTAGDPNTSIFFQLELNDFGQIGSNPIQTLRRSIPGYRRINELPSGSLLPEN